MSWLSGAVRPCGPASPIPEPKAIMTNRSTLLLTISAASIVACSRNAPPSTPETREVETTAVTPAPAPGAALTDERAMELGRGYIELLAARDFAQLWQHLAPQPKERFGTVERFRAETEGALNTLGKEVGVISERIEPARQGMVATKLYFRISRYTGNGETPVGLMIGLTNDGSIAGMQLRRGDQ